jgi:hypothetical protein
LCSDAVALLLLLSCCRVSPPPCCPDLDAELELLQGLGWGELLEAETGPKDVQGGSLWLGGMAFALADADGGLATRGVLPKGTKRT